MNISFLRNNLICIRCKTTLSYNEIDFFCSNCMRVYQKTNNSINFLPINLNLVNYPVDSLDKIKSQFKKFPFIYKLLIEFFSPTYFNKASLRLVIRELESKQLIGANFGCGPFKLSKNLINLDMIDYDNVDLVSTVEETPFRDNSLDVVISIAVLEHVKSPDKVVDEMFRVLKPNGTIYCHFPFIYSYHASPDDFTRVTEEGMKNLFTKFKIEKIEKLGPTSSLLNIFQEWVCSLFSFGNRKIHNFLYIICLLIFWPIKYLDFFLSREKFINNIPAGIVILAKK